MMNTLFLLDLDGQGDGGYGIFTTLRLGEEEEDEPVV